LILAVFNSRQSLNFRLLFYTINWGFFEKRYKFSFFASKNKLFFTLYSKCRQLQEFSLNFQSRKQLWIIHPELIGTYLIRIIVHPNSQQNKNKINGSVLKQPKIPLQWLKTKIKCPIYCPLFLWLSWLIMKSRIG